MNKKIIIGFIIVLLVICVIELANINNKEDDFTTATDENIVNGTSEQREITEIIENTTIQGIVELKSDENIYLFNGQHFGEYGFEMQEYTTTNIDNKNQECIDYCTSEKYDTSYIQEGDIIICTGDLKEYSVGNSDFDTKNNAIIVLKEKDYNTIKEEAINGKKAATISIGEYYEHSGEIYIRYDIVDNGYKLPFVLKFIINNDVKIIGDLEIGKEIKIKYKDLNSSINELELETIEVIEN